MRYFKLLRADGSSINSEHGRVKYNLAGAWQTVPGAGAFLATNGRELTCGGWGPMLAEFEVRGTITTGQHDGPCATEVRCIAHWDTESDWPDEWFAAVVKARPGWAQENPHACARLSAKQFAAIVKAAPGWALEYPHVCARLTARQFAAAVKARPGWALEYPHACARLSAKQFAAVVKAAPGWALKYPHACDRMTAKQFAAIVKAAPRFRG